MFNKKSLIFGLALTIGFFAVFFLRIFPYFVSDPIPLGYDPGLYKTVFEGFRNNLPFINVNNLDSWSRTNPIGLFLLTNILYFFSYTTEFLLTYFFAFLSAVIGIFIYLLVSQRFQKHKWLSFFASFVFFFISITQYHTFYMNYYKNVLGIILMLTAFILLKKKSRLSVLPLGFLIAVHRPTAIFTAGVLLIYILKDLIPIIWKNLKEKKKNNAVIRFIKNSLDIKVGLLAIVIGLPLYIYNFHESLLNMIQPVSESFGLEGGSGSFFSILEYLYYSLWFWPFAIYALITSIKKKTFSYIEIGFVFGVLWVFFHMFFYNRMIIQLDIFLIMMAVIGAVRLFTRIKKPYLKIFTPFAVLFFVLIGLHTFYYVHVNAKPLLEPFEFRFIQTIPEITEENSIIISTHKYYSPWLMGYSGYDVLAPGLFDLNRWSKEIWEEFWNGDGEIKASMLKEYNDLKSPLYIYEGINQPHYSFDNSDCFEYIRRGQYNLIKYLCRD